MKMKIVKLDTLVWFQEGPGVRNTQYTKKGVKLINVTNLVDGLLDLSLTSRYISEEEAYGKYKHFLCDEGDLVIASSGITYDSIPNKVSFIRKSDLPLCMNTSVIRFKSLDSKKVNIKYLYYFFKSNCFRNQISKLMTGSAQLNFGPSHLHKVFIPICEKEKQDHIVESLDNLYLAANSISKEVSLFDELIRTRFIEMFGTIDLFEEKNECQTMESVSSICTGTTPSTTDAANWDGDILWITPAEMNSETFFVYDTERKITEQGKKSKSLDLMPEGTVLLSTRAPIGKVGIVGKPMCCNQGFKNFVCSKSINPVYLYVLLKNNTEYLNSLGSGTTFLEVSKSKIEKMKIPVPKIDLQNSFSDFVISSNEAKKQSKKKAAQIDNLINKYLEEYYPVYEEE